MFSYKGKVSLTCKAKTSFVKSIPNVWRLSFLRGINWLSDVQVTTKSVNTKKYSTTCYKSTLALQACSYGFFKEKGRGGGRGY